MKKVMNKLILICMVLVTILSGCQNTKEQSQSSNTWGDRNSIRTEDVHTIEIQDMKDPDRILTLTQQEMNIFISAISDGAYDIGQLDIGPPDYSVEIYFNNGAIKKLHLWILDGGNLFTDQGTKGHFVIDENARAEIKGILEDLK
ncbi:hypothetical protein [Paenibacillus dakarensis]|uniref:hypothetical protein n=1 Tax=Paenibacillus dakarensis TaxID=1527293 RepID=UPI0006D55186|nr:hypothetical protein [Paenibacillus dakarensis]